MKIAVMAAPLLLVAALMAGIACGNGEENLGGAATQPTATPTEEGAWEVWATEGDEGTEITLRMGDSLVVALDSNPTTGYSWSLVSISNESVLQKVSDEYVPDPTPTGEPVAGSGGEEIWSFQPVASGTALIQMEYIRPWEPEEPAGCFNLTIIVQ